MKKILIFLLALLALTTLATAQTTVTGTVTAADGKSPITGNVLLCSFNGDMRRPLQAVTVGKDGRFTIQVMKAGSFKLYVSAPHHDYTVVPLIVDEGLKEATVNVQLAALSYTKQINEVHIIGSWNKFDFQSAATMTKQPNGTFTYTTDVPKGWDTVRYQLLDIVADKSGNPTQRSVNGTQNHHFTFDGGGDYFSVVKTSKGKATITFDPAKLLRSDIKEAITFGKNTPSMQDVLAAYTVSEQAKEQVMTEVTQARARGQEIKLPDISPAARALGQYMNSANTSISEFAAMQYVSLLAYGLKPDSGEAMKVLKIVPPSSASWEMNPMAPSALASLLPKDAQKTFMQSFLGNSPSRLVQGFALVALTRMARADGDLAQQKTLHALLTSDYGEIRELRYDIANLNPDMATGVGKQVPEFELTLLTGEKVSDKTMLGKFYMIDFWATWCGPCVGEMPTIHAAYEKFKNKGLNILSLSFDRTADVIAPFRQKKWAMPWMHAFIEQGFSNDMSKRFEVAGIPKPLLINPQGKIVATEEDLRGPMLEKTLEKFLGNM